MSNDIVRFMDEKRLTMATIGGHGFGAKVATATAINNNHRFTGVMCLDGGPLDHTYYEAYQELKEYVTLSRNLKVETHNANDIVKKIYERIPHPKWRNIVLSNILTDKGAL